MTREQAKREIDSLDFYLQNHTDDYGEESHTAMMMAIKALEQEPCEDAVSRQAVLDKKELVELEDGQSFYCISPEDVETLPSVNPQPKTGHWIEIAKYSDGRHEIECSECGSHIFDRGHANSYVVKEKYKYCPRCGCRMVESQESEEV